MGLHPDIYATYPKELHFFYDPLYNPAKIEEYKEYFATEKQLAGASPQNYTKAHRDDFKHVPERLYKHIPDIKLIYIVRDPIKRIYSHYKEARANNYAPKEGLNKYLKNYTANHYILTSMYYYQISQYLEYFPRKNILIVELEELKHNKLNTLNQIFEFLSVRKIDNEELFNFKKNESDNKKEQSFLGKIITYYNLTRPFNWLIPNELKSKFEESSLYKNITKKKIEDEAIDPVLLDEIKFYLKEDKLKLERLTNKNHYNWDI